MHTTDEYLVVPKGSAAARAECAEEVYRRVWRFDFRPPGFALIDLGSEIGSSQFSAYMVELRDRLGDIFAARHGRRLAMLSVGRFDQQSTTRFHLDGGPDESILMLGYEPSSVASRLSAADYSKCAHDLGMGPKQFLEDLNPMFGPGERKLGGYVTELSAADHRRFQIYLVNNSSADDAFGRSGALGVMHKAEVPASNPNERRIIGSVMLGVGDPSAADVVTPAERAEFVRTEHVIKRY
jgi:hypothetical protein